MNRPVVSDPYLNAMGEASALITAMKLRESRMSEEEKADNKARYKALQEQRRVRACIHQGVCAECQSKLIRGKKDKKNDYKRSWSCPKCFEVYSL